MHERLAEAATVHRTDASAALHRRVLVLDGALDDDNGTLLATQLLTLAAEDPWPDIALWIHSPGGRCRRCSRSATSCGSSRATSRRSRSGSPAAQGSSCCRRARRASGSRCRTRGSSCTRARRASAAPRSRSRCRPRTCGTPATRCSASSRRTPGSRRADLRGLPARSLVHRGSRHASYGFIDHVVERLRRRSCPRRTPLRSGSGVTA